MREMLTVLAGLLLVALLTALVGPHFVDWRQHRQGFEQHLGEALGAPVTVAGEIGVRLLPSPRLTLRDVRVGGGREQASTVAAETVVVELSLASLARGEVRLTEADLDGAVLTLRLNEAGQITLPHRGDAALPTQTSIDRLSLRRSALIWRQEGRESVTVSPISVDLSAAALAGPWRIEGEADGTSFRISTGTMEADGRLRTRLHLTGEHNSASFDGAVLLPATESRVMPALDGSFTLSPGGAFNLAGRVTGGVRQLDLAGLIVEIAGGAARLEGEGRFVPADGTGTVTLGARRIDGEAVEAAFAERPGALQALSAMPGRIDLSLTVEQLALRGEDVTKVSLSGRLAAGVLSGTVVSGTVAGARVDIVADAGEGAVSGRIGVAAPDSRRVALALVRAGLEPGLAELIAGMGRIEANASGAWRDGQVRLDRVAATGSAGMRMEGGGELTPQRLSATLAVHDLDLGALPSGEALRDLFAGRDLVLNLGLHRARLGSAPTGNAFLDLRREGPQWRLNRLSVDGFGGVAVTGAGALLPEGGEISGKLSAPRFEPLAALAGPALPEGVREALRRAGDGLSRIAGEFRLARPAAGDASLRFRGTAQAGSFGLEGRIAPDGRWTRTSLEAELSERGVVFSMLGLPRPQQGGPARLAIRRDSESLSGVLVGPGFSMTLETGATNRLGGQVESPAAVLPGHLARLLPDAPLDLHARPVFEAEAVALGALVANLPGGSARGSLRVTRQGAVSGDLALPVVDLRALLAAALGESPAPATGWSATRFGPAAGLGNLDLRLAAQRVGVREGLALTDARFALRSDSEGLRIEEFSAGHGGGKVGGFLSARRDGGLAQLSMRLDGTELDLGQLTDGALTGRLSGRIEAGGAGESPARLVAGLGGAGTLVLSGSALSRFDPGAYGRVIAGTGYDASESETARLQKRIGEALDSAAWPIGSATLPFTLAGGVLRLQPMTLESAGMRAETSGMVDLRQASADVRLTLSPSGALPKGWPEKAPQLVVAWRGPLADLRREADVSALANTVAARTLAREIERVEAFEADQRERQMHARRLRAERETRESERKLGEFLRAEEERRKIEEARRLAEEKKAEEARRIEEARQAEEARRRAEAEERARAAAAARAGAAQPVQPPSTGGGPLVLPGAPQASTPAGEAVPPLPPPVPVNPLRPPAGTLR